MIFFYLLLISVFRKKTNVFPKLRFCLAAFSTTILLTHILPLGSSYWVVLLIFYDLGMYHRPREWAHPWLFQSDHHTST